MRKTKKGPDFRAFSLGFLALFGPEDFFLKGGFSEVAGLLGWGRVGPVGPWAGLPSVGKDRRGTVVQGWACRPVVGQSWPSGFQSASGRVEPQTDSGGGFAGGWEGLAGSFFSPIGELFALPQSLKKPFFTTLMHISCVALKGVPCWVTHLHLSPMV